MRKWLLSLCMVLALVACKDEKKETAQTDARPVVKIGVNLPMTGDMAMAGKVQKASLELALRDVEKQNTKYKYELIVEDNVFQPKKTVSNLYKFKSVDKVQAVMSLWGTDGTVTSDWAEKNKILHMSCSESDVVGKGYYNFNHAPKLETYRYRMMKYFKDHNYKKIAFLYENALEVVEYLDKFIPMLKENGFDIVYQEAVDRGVIDVRTSIYKIKQAQPDVLYAHVLAPTLQAFAKQSHELGLNVPLVNMNIFGFYPETFEGASYFTASIGKSTFPERFKRETGLNMLPCTVNLFDGFKMIVDGFEKAPVKDGNTLPTTEDVVETMLHNKDFDTALSSINIDEDGNIDSSVIVKTIVNGETVVAEE